MCAHEIWNYAECGCQVDHLIPCLNALISNEGPSEASQFRRCRRKTSLRGIRSPSPLLTTKKHGSNTSPIHLPPSPSPTDSESSSRIEDYYRQPERSQPRECSINHTITKTFLEPICDECLLKELGVEKRPSEQPINVLATAGEALIWDSDVKIEISEEKLVSPEPEILESNIEVLVEEAVQDTLPALKFQDGPIGHARQPSSLSATDADDEGSFRGRARSRTKQLRRKGIDITREQLRISSRVPTLDREALEAFRDDLQKKAQDAVRFEQGEQKKEQSPSKNLLTRFKEVENGSKSWARGVVGSLKRSLSRNSRRGRQEKDDRWQATSTGSTPQLAQSGVCTLRAVIEDALIGHDDHGSAVAVAEEEEEEACPAPDVPFSRFEPQPESLSSWQAHLSQDLASRQRQHKQFTPTRSTSGLHSINSSEPRTSNGANWFAKPTSSGSLPLYSISKQESRRHLLSRTSTAPSIPGTASSSTWSGPAAGQRLASIVSDSDFDTFPDQPWNSPLVLTRHEANEATINNDAASVAASSHHYGTSIDTKTSIHTTTTDSASPPRPTNPHTLHRHIHTDTPRPTKGLAINPLTTPIHVTAPFRPAFTARTSSFSSPPLSSPARLGGAGIGLPHSPTAHFVCIWERYLCHGGCGKVVGESVRSCVCWGEEEEEDEGEGGEQRHGQRHGQAQGQGQVPVQRQARTQILRDCRSTGPVVRYMLAADDTEKGAECGRCRGHGNV